MSVFDSLVGQSRAVASLQRAADGDGLTQAWLFTGPPGSGRSNAALAFAAALQCDQSPAGCGACQGCRTTLARSHADLTLLRTEKLSIGVDDVRELVRHSALTPVGQRWQIMIVEDADRLTEQAANALLKAIEEPNQRTIWMLCAPTVEDVLATIRSRCRLIALATPSAHEVADFLQRHHEVEAALAAFAARASQGHIGRAKALATDELARNRRREVVSIPFQLTSVGAAMAAAANLTEATKEEAAARSQELDKAERAQLDSAYGVVERGRKPREYGPALAELERAQKLRAKRAHLDMVDRSLMDLVSVYRDAIALASDESADLVNAELRAELVKLAQRERPEQHLRRIDTVFATRQQMLEFNVPVLLALEGMMCGLLPGVGHRAGDQTRERIGEWSR